MKIKKRLNHLKNSMKEALKQGDLERYEKYHDEYLSLRKHVKMRREELKQIRREYCWR